MNKKVRLNKVEKAHLIKTINMMCRYLCEYTPPDVKYSEINGEVAKIIMALNKLKKL